MGNVRRMEHQNGKAMGYAWFLPPTPALRVLLLFRVHIGDLIPILDFDFGETRPAQRAFPGNPIDTLEWK